MFCGCERWTVISACRLNIHDTVGVCVCALHVCISHLTVFVKIQTAVFTCASFHTDTPWWQILSAACVCVREKKKKTEERGRETLVGVVENKWMHTSVLGAICFGCMLIWMLVLCCGLRRAIVITLPNMHPCRGAGFIWRMLCFCVSRQSQYPDGTDRLSPW